MKEPVIVERRSGTRPLAGKIAMLDLNLAWREQVPEGWGSLLERLLVEIAEIDPALRVTDAKQKFGSLRVRLDRYDESAYALIDKATSESLGLCERCGAAAALRNDGGYYATLCEDHAGNSELAVASPSISVRLLKKCK